MLMKYPVKNIENKKTELSSFNEHGLRDLDVGTSRCIQFRPLVALVAYIVSPTRQLKFQAFISSHPL